MNNLFFLVGYILPNFMSILYKFMAKISIFFIVDCASYEIFFYPIIFSFFMLSLQLSISIVERYGKKKVWIFDGCCSLIAVYGCKTR